MTLLDAPELDPTIARRRKQRMIAAILFVVIFLGIGVLGFLMGHGWWFRFWPEERVAGHFFDALQKQDYNTAYGIWMQDPEWKQHPDRYSRYPYNDFINDWGPSGEWGIIKSHHIDGAKVPEGYSGSPFATASGVVVVVTVNQRVSDKAHIWVQKDDKTLGFSPY